MVKTIKLPELTDLNTYINAERRNRFLGAKIKKEMTDLVAWYFKMEHFPKMNRIIRFELTWTHKNKKKDFDGVEFSQKFIRDGMIKAGVIENDGWVHFPPRTLHQHVIDRIGFPGVSVLIEYE